MNQLKSETHGDIRRHVADYRAIEQQVLEPLHERVTKLLLVLLR